MRQSKYHKDIPNDTKVTIHTKARIDSLDDIQDFLKIATGADLYAFVENLWGNDTDAGRGLIMWLVEDCLGVGHLKKPELSSAEMQQVLKYLFAEFLVKRDGDQ